MVLSRFCFELHFAKRQTQWLYGMVNEISKVGVGPVLDLGLEGPRGPGAAMVRRPNGLEI